MAFRLSFRSELKIGQGGHCILVFVGDKLSIRCILNQSNRLTSSPWFLLDLVGNVEKETLARRVIFSVVHHLFLRSEFKFHLERLCILSFQDS